MPPSIFNGEVWHNIKFEFSIQDKAPWFSRAGRVRTLRVTSSALTLGGESKQSQEPPSIIQSSHQSKPSQTPADVEVEFYPPLRKGIGLNTYCSQGSDPYPPARISTHLHFSTFALSVISCWILCSFHALSPSPLIHSSG